MISAAADDAERCLRRVWQDLTACGFMVDEPVGMSFFHGLRGAQAEMDLLRGGALVWEFVSIPQGSINPLQAARMVLALLAPGPVPASLPPASGPGLPLKDAAAQMLAACEMMTRPAGIRYPYPDPGPAPEVHTEVVVRNLARHARGYARITGEGTIRWHASSPPRKPGQRAGSPRRRPGHRRRPPRVPRRRQRRHPGQQHRAGRGGGPDLTEAAS